MSQLLQPATLLNTLHEKTQQAIACGALHTIETERRFIEEMGVRFLVSAVSSLKRKAEDKGQRKRQEHKTGKTFNPFLPPEPELALGAITATHLCVLNKFNVLENHLLIVTKRFEHQETLLTLADFEAQWLVLQGIDGLAFYNGGTEAGASQEHKHLQLAPLPLTPDTPDLPMESLFMEIEGEETTALPFDHAFRRLPPKLWQQPGQAAAETHRLYREMLEQLGIYEIKREGELRQSAPYNLLIRRNWMLLVPRRREHFDTISINALGFAGSLFVRDDRELKVVADTGPMAILAAVSERP